MTLKNRVVLYTFVVVATLLGCTAYAFGQTVPSDQLGLQAQSQAADNKIPVVVGAAVEASRLQAAYGFYFGNSGSLYSTQMGAEIQSMVSDALLDLGYNPLAPKTGYQRQQRTSVRSEVSPDTGRKAELAKTASFVCIPQISFITSNGRERQIDLGPVISLVASEVGGGTGRVIRSTVGGARTRTVGQMVEAKLALRFYDANGQQLRTYEAVENISWQAYQEFRTALLSGRSVNNPTLVPLAQKLVAAAKARMAS